jgi:16S rRNA (cytosine1402-N4)-methyltransferase
VAKAIVHDQPQTTTALAALVRRVVPKSKDGLDPATRTFQALRMLVNEEQQELQSWLTQVPHILADGGVAVAISFHSLEDRMVKRYIQRETQGDPVYAGLPDVPPHARATLRRIGKKVVASPAEVEGNPRARSRSRWTASVGRSRRQQSKYLAIGLTRK